MCTCHTKPNRFVRSGPNIHVGEKKLHSVTWANCPVNVVYALHGRHGSVRTRPDPDNLKKFLTFAKERVKAYAAKGLIHLLQTDISIDDYMSKFPKSKQ